MVVVLGLLLVAAEAALLDSCSVDAVDMLNVSRKSVLFFAGRLSRGARTRSLLLLVEGGSSRALY